ncbi:MAG: EF-hand domain-containing protein [Thiobacillus sp.]|nr:EF-hand domain-containing protein [Thiobacillus sp.]
MRGTRQRPDPAEMAENLFAQLDTSGQGYIQKSDLQAAYDKVSSSTSTSNASSASSNVDDLFAQLDTDSDGKVTKQELSDSLKKLQDALEQQLQDSRMQMAMQAGGMDGMNGMSGMPPPPPPQNGDDQGFTKEELSSQLEEIGSSDSERSSMISNVIKNFEAADTNGDGKVSFQEAMALQQSSSNSSSSDATTSSTSSSTSSSSASSNSEAKVMIQIMKLMQAYITNNSSNAEATTTLSVTA